MSELDTDLKVIFPEPVYFTAGVEQVEVKNIKIGKLKRVFSAVAPFVGVIVEHAKQLEKDKSAKLNLFQIFIDNSDNVCEFLALVIDKPVEWVQDLDVAQAVELFSKVLEVNLDFFIQRVLPSVSQATGQLVAGLSVARDSVGPAPSKS